MPWLMVYAILPDMKNIRESLFSLYMVYIFGKVFRSVQRQMPCLYYFSVQMVVLFNKAFNCFSGWFVHRIYHIYAI